MVKNQEASKFYNQSGMLQKTGQYKNDKRSGEWRVYTPKGTVKLIGQYDNDLELGEFKWFDTKGKLEGWAL